MHMLKQIKLGDGLKFPDANDIYYVKYVGFRYIFACTEDGCFYTIVDKIDECLASTTMTFEEYANFNIEGNAEKLESLLTSGDRELSQKYRDSFKDWNLYQGKIIKKGV